MVARYVLVDGFLGFVANWVTENTGESVTMIVEAMKYSAKRLCLYLSGILGGNVLFGCVLKPAPSQYSDYHTNTPLIFPLTGESLIGTGERSVQQNPDHIFVADQRFAIDIVALAPGSLPPERHNLVKRALSGKLNLYEGDDFENNARHFCFGRQVVAPGDGIVVDVRDGVYDNIPGKRNTRDIPGNYVVIDHLNGEFSLLAHLKQSSVSVKQDAQVKAGDPIGQCGNSGNSNLPHLHYHLQNTPRWLDGEGLPAQFMNYYANGKFVERGEPAQGEIIFAPP